MERLEEASPSGHSLQQSGAQQRRDLRGVGIEEDVRTLRRESGHLQLRLDATVRRERRIEHVLRELIER